MARGRPRRLRRLPAGRRGGRRTSSTRRRSPASRARSASRSQSHASGPTATLNVLEAARQAGVRRVMFAASSSAYGETDELPKHEAMFPRPLSPYAAGKLAGEHYVARLRPDDGPRRREPPLLQHLRPPAGPVEPLQRRDLAVRPAMSRGPAADRSTATAGRPATSPTWPTPSRPTSPPMRAEGPLGRRGPQRRHRPADQPARPGRGDQRDRSGPDLEPEFRPPRAGDVRDSQASLERIRGRPRLRARRRLRGRAAPDPRGVGRPVVNQPPSVLSHLRERERSP